jgi:hypothetical protein
VLEARNSSLQPANYVSLLGHEYELYGTRIVQNGVTGAGISGADQEDWDPVHCAFRII